MRTARIGLTLATLLGTTASVGAHPHVLVDARSEIVFDPQGRISAIRQIWQFDEAFTAFAIQGLDADGDGQLTDTELAPLAKVNVDSLEEFDFFTYLDVDEKSYSFSRPEEYWLEFYGGRLTLFYTLPLVSPVAVGSHTTIEVYDPEYFVAFTYVADAPATLVDAPDGCEAVYSPPQELDDATASLLATIPASQRDLPPDLQAMTAGISNRISVACQ